ncbi:MAG: hypothetical protein JWR69_3448 [Pedosphaera sp.]|nr:hypothetical protein [Pedosphaera sp.]
MLAYAASDGRRIPLPLQFTRFDFALKFDGQSFQPDGKGDHASRQWFENTGALHEATGGGFWVELPTVPELT